MTEHKNPARVTMAPDELDIRSRRELGVQSMQAVFHCLMAVLVAYGIPRAYLANPVEAVVDSYLHLQPEPWGVRVPYILSITYHGILYFWDPMSTTTLKARHVFTIMMGTALFFCEQLGWGLLVMLTNYFFDSVEFVQHRLNKLHPHRTVIASMTKIHHMVTIMLLGVSWIFGLAPFGMVVLFIHDATDVPMFVIRIVRRKGAGTGIQALVVLGVISTWVYYRVWCLMMVIYQTVMLMSQPVIKEHGLQVSLGSCTFGLSILWIFNVYWTSLVIYKTIREGLLGSNMEVHHE